MREDNLYEHCMDSSPIGLSIRFNGFFYGHLNDAFKDSVFYETAEQYLNTLVGSFMLFDSDLMFFILKNAS